MVACTLCGKPVGREVASVSVRDICDAYREELGVDASAEFGSDIGPELALLECDACGLRLYAPTVVGSSRFYDELQRHEWYYARERPEYQEAARFVSASHSLLEIGCGKGVFAGKVRPREYVGIEPSEKARLAASAAGLRVVGDRLEDYAARHAGEHDVVATFQVLEHVPAPRRFLEEAMRCVRPGGLLILSVPNDDSYLRLAHNQLLNIPPHHQTRWSRRAVESIGRELALQLLAVWQQPVADENLRDLAAVMVEAFLRGWREPKRLVDRSWRWRRRWKTCNSIGKRLLPLIRRPWLRPPGASMTAVFAKGE